MRESNFNKGVNLFILLFVVIFNVFNLIMLLTLLISFVIRVRKSHYGLCGAISDEFKKMCSNICDALKNWFYPEHILSNVALTHSLIESVQGLEIEDE